jgi:hypothetical protein
MGERHVCLRLPLATALLMYFQLALAVQLHVFVVHGIAPKSLRISKQSARTWASLQVRTMSVHALIAACRSFSASSAERYLAHSSRVVPMCASSSVNDMHSTLMVNGRG